MSAPMRAVQLTASGPVPRLALTDAFEPGHPDDGEVLVSLAAAGVTPLEHTVATGGLPFAAPVPLVLGNEGAGVVVASRDPAWEPGARVAFTGPYGVLRAGSWAEAALVSGAHLIRVPDAVPLTTAAAMPVAYLTAHLALQQARFAPGKSVLATAAGGSVGNATHQLANALGAGRVITTAGTRSKAEAARAAGMTDVVDLSQEDLAGAARELTGGAGVDVVIDAVGGAVLSASLGALAPGAAAVTIGYSGGRTSDLRVTDLIWTGANLSGFSLLAQAPDTVASAGEAVYALAATGQITPVIARVMPLEDAPAALAHLIDDRPFGKVVLSIGA